MSKWQDPVSWMMLQKDDPVLFKKNYEQTATKAFITQSDDSCHLYSLIVSSIHFVPFNVSNSKRNWAKFGVGVKLIVILRHIIAYFSINIRWHSQHVSSDSRKWLIKHLNKQNSYNLLAFFQSGSVPELDMHESKHVLPGQFVHSVQGFVHYTTWICIQVWMPRKSTFNIDQTIKETTSEFRFTLIRK
jgi:hypothetical protein